MTVSLPRISVEDVILQYALEQFFYEEAALLDARKFKEWFELLDDDLEYFMPVRTNRTRDEQDLEFSKPGTSGAYFDDDIRSMRERVRKLYNEFSWSEDPPSRTRHSVSNLRIIERNGDLITTSCNFFIYRSRLASEYDLWSGRREDTLRAVDGAPGFKIVKRHIYLDDVRLRSKNLSSLF